MSMFEITQGDYGEAYRGRIEKIDLSAYTAKVYIWDKSDAIIINGKDCIVSFVSPDTFIAYTPATGDFDAVPPDTYRGVFVLNKTGAKQHIKPFTIQVLKKPPGT